MTSVNGRHRISIRATLVATVIVLVSQSAPAEPKLSETVESIRGTHKLPALAAAVIIDGKLVDYAAVGVRRSGSEIQVTRDDKFHIGSCTKTMTATLIGILVDRGRLRWDSTIAEVLPDLGSEIHADYRSVTVDVLLMHRSGLPSASETYKGVKVAELPENPREQRLEYIRQVMQKPPAFKPGSRKQYSNAGYSVLGVMAETLMDKAWEELITDLVFSPLEMESAGFGAMGNAVSMDQPWQHKFQNGKFVPVRPGPRADNLDAIGPGGKVHCSMADWSKFISVHLGSADSDKRLVKPETLSHLLTAKFGGDYAGGWVLMQRPWAHGTALFHNGSNTMNYCSAWLSPKRHFAVLQATNCAGPAARKACDDVASAVIDQYLNPSPPTATVRQDEDKEITKRAMEWFSLVQNQKIPLQQLDQGLRKFFESAKGTQFCQTLKQLGTPADREFHGSRKQGTTTIYVYKLKFASGDWRWEIGFAGESKVTWILARSPF